MTGRYDATTAPTTLVGNPILQFGTSRFLLAHADLFVSQAMESGQALGCITLVQTTDSIDSARRVEALASGAGYRVRIRGRRAGATIDEEVQGRAVTRALSARRDWKAVRGEAIDAAVILSNTGDRGFDLDPGDTPASVADRSVPPKSFPAKIAVLLLERFEHAPERPVSIFPCELVSRNGDKLRALVRDLAVAWDFPAGFLAYLEGTCRFANSLVDRIVSEPLQPVGAVAEPYALWAIERQNGLVPPCTHPAIVMTDDLSLYEDLKLHVLNLGHTVLAELWLADKRPKTETVRQILGDAGVLATLESVWQNEVVPIFAARGLGDAAQTYVAEVRERFLNPFLAHRLSDIAVNHAEKMERRLKPLVEWGRAYAPPLDQPILTRILEARHA